MAPAPPRRAEKERLYELFAQIAAALANPHRLELVDLLVQAPRTVEELAREAQMSVANTSQHLQRLKQARLVVGEREGLYARYRLADPAIARLWVELRAVAERQLAEVERALSQYRPQRDEFRTIPIAELHAGLRAQEIILVDVRPAPEYAAAHLPGARSMPLGDLPGRLEELVPGKLVVTYCRGPYCAYADEALSLIAAAGWEVARLEEGVLEWHLAGYPIEITP